MWPFQSKKQQPYTVHVIWEHLVVPVEGEDRYETHQDIWLGENVGSLSLMNPPSDGQEYPFMTVRANGEKRCVEITTRSGAYQDMMRALIRGE